MKIVIDIPDAEYERIQAMDWKNGDRWYSCESVAIHNGTPLPKGRGWIPVSERLPDDSGEYLVTVVDKDVEMFRHIGIAWYAHPKDYDVKEGDWRELMTKEKVIAWMPLPESYKGESEEV